MAYQSLYRRYRPRRFSELRGQPHVVTALRNAVRDDRVGHAYLFSGPRGTGKTSTARILAKALNCEHPDAGEPCGTCASCTAIDAGASFDVIELDAASNNGVADVRELIERSALASGGRRKVYILDEVHMLSKPAEAALLKTLEEPPPHVVFVLATTDPHKVNETIRSRTQHLEFHLLPAAELADHLRYVVADAGLDVDDRTLQAVLREGRGSARDTLSALDLAVATGGMGSHDDEIVEVVEAMIAADAARALGALGRAVTRGTDPRSFGDRLVAHLRDALVSLLAPEVVNLPEAALAVVTDQGRRLGAPGAARAIETIGTAMVDLRAAADPRVVLDVALVRLTRPEVDGSTDALLHRIDRLEQQLAALTRGAAPGAIAAPGPAERPATPGAPPRPGDPGPRPSARDRMGAAAMRPAPAAAPPPAASPAPAPTPPAPPADGPDAPTIAPAPPRPAAPAPVSSPVSSPGPAGAGDPVGAARATALWGERVRPALKGSVRALYAVAEVAGVGPGLVRLAIPNEPHRQRCAKVVDDVEAGFAQAGLPVRVELIVAPPDARGGRDSGGRPAGEPGPSAPPEDEPPAPDLSEFTQVAHDPTPDALARLLTTFPGSTVVDADTGR
jgi:DNA polymerase-3 subunit gamma/tau